MDRNSPITVFGLRGGFVLARCVPNQYALTLGSGFLSIVLPDAMFPLKITPSMDVPSEAKSAGKVSASIRGYSRMTPLM